MVKSEYLCKKCHNWILEEDFNFDLQVCDECYKTLKECFSCKCKLLAKFCPKCGICGECG